MFVRPQALQRLRLPRRLEPRVAGRTRSRCTARATLGVDLGGERFDALRREIADAVFGSAGALLADLGERPFV